MAANLKTVKELVQETLEHIAASDTAWQDFLNFQAKLYKHNFNDTLLVYAQRPDATAVALYEIWDRIIKRTVKNGTGIAVLDDNGGLKYLFDVSDTIGHEHTALKPWEIGQEQLEAIRQTLLDQLPEAVRVDNLDMPLESVIMKIAMDKVEPYEQSILCEPYSEELNSLFGTMAVLSAGYAICDRCDFDKNKFVEDTLFNVLKLADASYIMRLGEAVSAIAQSILRPIEQTVKRLEKEAALERLREQEQVQTLERSEKYESELHRESGRELLPESGAAATVSTEEIRQHGEELHERDAAVAVYGAVVERDADDGTSSSGRESGSAAVENGGRIDEIKPVTGNREFYRNRATPQLSPANSRRYRTERDRVREQVERTDQQLNLFETAAQAAVSPIQDGLERTTEEKLPYLDAPSEMTVSAVRDDSIFHTPPIIETVQENTPIIEETPFPASDYRITEESNVGKGSIRDKIINNIKAIRTLKTLESENRTPTPEEQHSLARYVGWGGIPQVFDEKNNLTMFATARDSLQNLLADEEYRAARSSTVNAHYTSTTVISAMYNAVQRFGFKGGSIMEPSMAVGNFYGMLPEELRNSRLAGVELDSISGRIAQKLYPNADIRIQGFEDTNIRDNSYDLVIGNVPFGAYKVADPRYDKYNFHIHDYFIAKSLDVVKPGGMVAVISTKGTLDKQNSAMRKYIAQRAELVGAIRLPNNAFLQNANTEVTTDILFLQKRERIQDATPDWVHLEQTEDGVPINAYFSQHSEMVLGKMVFDKSMYGKETDTACHPIEGADLAEQLQQAVLSLNMNILHIEDVAEETQTSSANTLPADPNVKDYTYTVVDGQIYFRDGDEMCLHTLAGMAAERVRGMVGVREAVRDIIDIQLAAGSEEAFQTALKTLNERYDAFVKKCGHIDSGANKRVFHTDTDYPLLCSLEHKAKSGAIEKTDIFFQRTIRPAKEITHADTAVEALALSLHERGFADVPYMAGLTGKSEETIIQDLHGLIFRNPSNLRWETPDEYLCGDVREKLAIAEQAAKDVPEYKANIVALKNVQPEDVGAGDIEVRLGAKWIPADVYKDFIIELLNPRKSVADSINVHYSDSSTHWFIENKNMDWRSFAATQTWGTQRMSAYEIIEQTLNLKNVRVMDKQDDGSYVYNSKESIAAAEKQALIRQKFKEWVFDNPQRRERLVRLYNDTFNNIRLRRYDGNHLTFPGMNPAIELKPHQKNAVARVIYGGNALLAHKVGAGKTFEVAAAAMELRRLGMAKKPMIDVPNHLLKQWGKEFQTLYPSANLLLATKADFAPWNRKKFCARIATGNYDAVIMGHSSFEKIPLSKERRERLVREQIDEAAEAIEEMRDNDDARWTVKQMERTLKSLEAELKRLQSGHRKDNVVNFEELGVDALFVDEAQAYKNLFLTTKMTRIAGISTARALKSTDMFGKVQFINELSPGRNVVFATGTPVSNSMSEMFTMQRYLQMNELEKRGMKNFDSWASTFGETVTAYELSPTGSGFRPKERFARFFNLPELLRMYHMIADIQTGSMLKLPVPDIKGGKPETVVTKPSDLLKRYIESLVVRAEKVRMAGNDPRIDNMLKVTSDGRKAALDMRLVDPCAPDMPNSKLNLAVDNIHKIWRDTASKRLTQIAFCDLGTPGGDSFNVYADMKNKLIQRGIPESEIAFIHDAHTDEAKAKLFASVNAGDVRVLLGSTQKMGTGTNCQEKLIALHHLDVPWRPADVGRALRTITICKANVHIKKIRDTT